MFDLYRWCLVSPTVKQATELSGNRAIGVEGCGKQSGSLLNAIRRIAYAFAVIGFVAIAVAACSQPPAPVRMGTVVTESEGKKSLQNVKSSWNNVVLLPAPLRPVAAKRDQAHKSTAVIAAGTATVVAGDTVYAIARRHGVSVRGIVSVNGLQPPYLLLVGQKLRLPTGRGHVVVGGDTIYGLSQRYGVGMSALVRLNRLPSPYRLNVGQTLQIPSSVFRVETNVGTSDSAPVPDAPSAVGGGEWQFIWPTDGRLLSVYGDKGGGKFNEGINIAVEPGARVKATAAGTVAYAGNELRGYGNLLLIRHADGWMSAYAHNEELLVKRGDTVGRGQVVARAGRTGNVSRPQSHFELRRRGKAVDPLLYLPKANSSG